MLLYLTTIANLERGLGMRTQASKIFLGFAVGVLLLGSGCKPTDDRDKNKFLLLPIQYVAQVGFGGNSSLVR